MGPDHNLPRAQETLGLPSESLFQTRLVYNVATSTILLYFRLSRGRIPYSRIYLRRTSEESYRPAFAFDGDDFSAESPVLSEAGLLYFVLSEWKQVHGNFGSNYIGIGQVDLRTGTTEIWPTDTPIATRCFASELAAATSDGSTIYAVCGFRALTGIGPVEYHLCALDWKSRQITKIEQLDGVFF
jgi:hypothetical protein